MSATFAISNHHCTPVAANDNFVLPACSNAPCEHKVIQLYPKSEPKIGSQNRFIHGPSIGARCARVYNAAGRLVHVDNVATAKQEDYLYAGGMMIGRRDQNGAIAITHTDHLGGTVSQTDGAGNVQWRERYHFTASLRFARRFKTFGGELDNTTGTDDRAGFTGHIKDSATGLNYMQARYYDPVIGRFLSVDPVTFMETGEPAMFNRYSYAFNDPVNLTDPFGQAPCDIINCDKVKEVAADAAASISRGVQAAQRDPESFQQGVGNGVINGGANTINSIGTIAELSNPHVAVGTLPDVPTIAPSNEAEAFGAVVGETGFVLGTAAIADVPLAL